MIDEETSKSLKLLNLGKRVKNMTSASSQSKNGDKIVLNRERTILTLILHKLVSLLQCIRLNIQIQRVQKRKYLKNKMPSIISIEQSAFTKTCHSVCLACIRVHWRTNNSMNWYPKQSRKRVHCQHHLQLPLSVNDRVFLHESKVTAAPIRSSEQTIRWFSCWYLLN